MAYQCVWKSYLALSMGEDIPGLIEYIKFYFVPSWVFHGNCGSLRWTVTVRSALTALKLGKRLTAAAVSRGNGRNGLISSDGCKGGAGGRTSAGRAGLWHVPPRCRKKTEGIQQVLHKKATIKSKYWIKQIYFYLSTNYCISEKNHSWLSDCWL